ncbi:hypothetical protein [Streptomyces sp. NPDC048142]
MRAPIGLDPAVVDEEWFLIGSGKRRGKIVVPGKALAALPGAVLDAGLGV